MNWLYVAIGAAVGGLLRYAFALGFNQPQQLIPIGTLLANSLGGIGMGVVLAFNTGIHPELRLLFAVGVLGGLTTFSTYSAETFTLIQSGKLYMAALHACLHVLSALAMTTFAYYVTCYFVQK